MNVIPLLILCSLFLATCGVIFFLYSTKNRDHEHADRLSLLPLEDDWQSQNEPKPIVHDAKDQASDSNS